MEHYFLHDLSLKTDEIPSKPRQFYESIGLLKKNRRHYESAEVFIGDELRAVLA
jgi:hypothetical protein